MLVTGRCLQTPPDIFAGHTAVVALRPQKHTPITTRPQQGTSKAESHGQQFKNNSTSPEAKWRYSLNSPSHRPIHQQPYHTPVYHTISAQKRLGTGGKEVRYGGKDSMGVRYTEVYFFKLSRLSGKSSGQGGEGR